MNQGLSMEVILLRLLFHDAVRNQFRHRFFQSDVGGFAVGTSLKIQELYIHEPASSSVPGLRCVFGAEPTGGSKANAYQHQHYRHLNQHPDNGGQ